MGFSSFIYAPPISIYAPSTPYPHLDRSISELPDYDFPENYTDTEVLYVAAFSSLVSEYGKTYTWDTHVNMMGRKESEAFENLIHYMHLPLTVEDLTAKLMRLLSDSLPTAQLLPGAERLVFHLKKHNIPLAIASGSSKMTFDYKTTNHKELVHGFHHIVLASDDPDVVNGKPAPDPYLVAASRFEDNPHPEKVLVFEDSVNGVLSAHAAGMQCVWVPCDQIDRRRARNKATLVLNSLEEFRPEEFGLPAYD